MAFNELVRDDISTAEKRTNFGLDNYVLSALLDCNEDFYFSHDIDSYVLLGNKNFIRMVSILFEDRSSWDYIVEDVKHKIAVSPHTVDYHSTLEESIFDVGIRLFPNAFRVFSEIRKTEISIEKEVRDIKISINYLTKGVIPPRESTKNTSSDKINHN